jgi:predicted RecB family nuclease
VRSVSSNILLSGYAAKQCARRIHNNWDATIPAVAWEPSAEAQRFIVDGIAFEETIIAALSATLSGSLVLISPDQSKGDQMRATIGAMKNHVPVILGGWLPDDHLGGRTGRPDVMVLMKSNDGHHFYAPGDIKAHKTVKFVASGTLTYSTPTSPSELQEHLGLAEEIAGCYDDFIQLAHYSRMIDAAGFGPNGNERSGFIIGRDNLTEYLQSEIVLVWHDLTKPLFKTFSASKGSRKRSALERYDHEHNFRLKVATVAATRTGSATDPEPLVQPIGQDECTECPWESTCAVQLQGTASGDITSGRLSIREWLTLQNMGVTTTQDLAELDLEDQSWMTEYLARVPHQIGAAKRLTEAVTRATMVQSGEILRRISDEPMEIPQADIEIDFDIEWDDQDRVYLWGARIRDGQDDSTAQYKSFHSWDPLDEESERQLALEFASWLGEQINNAKAQGKTLDVYHYTSPEPRYLARILGEENTKEFTAHFVDLNTIMRKNFIGLHGLGIKKIAPAVEFEWRDEDPGGLQSQTWLKEARIGDGIEAENARRRLLQYNEDDVAATAAIRDGLIRFI